MNRNYKTNKPLFVGILSSGIYFFTKDLVTVPDFVRGFLLGTALASYIIGVYMVKHDISKLKELKKSLLKKYAHNMKLS